DPTNFLKRRLGFEGGRSRLRPPRHQTLFFGCVRPNDFPGETALLEHPDNITREIKLPPTQSVGSTTGLRMMIVMISFAESDHPDPKVISALIGRIETAVSELRHMTDRIDRPGDIINHQHWYVETPQHSGTAQCYKERHGDGEMGQEVSQGTLEQ